MIAELQRLLGPGYCVRNRGAGGRSTADGLAVFAAEVLAEGNYSIVVVWLGTNDISDNDGDAAYIEGNLQGIYNAAAAAGKPVVAVNIPPCKGATWWTTAKQTILDDVNTWTATVPAGVTRAVDVYSVLEDPANPDQLLPAYDYGDHVHLSAAGFEAAGAAIHAGGIPWT